MIRSLLTSLVCCGLFLPAAAPAAVVFSLSGPSGPITVGDSVTITVGIASDTAPISNLAGVDFVIDANDPGFTGTANSGRFTAGTNDLFSPAGGFALAFPSSFQVFGANAGTGLTLTTAPTTLATLTLSTTGATPGNYTMRLSSLLAVDPQFNALAHVAASPLSYQIVAATSPVPEPGSLLLCALGAVVLAGAKMTKTGRD